MKGKSGGKFISIVFWLLVADWVVFTVRILMPERIGISRWSFLPHLGSLLVLGIILGWGALKDKKMEKGLRKWLLVTSGSAVGIFVGAVLHNLLDAAAMVTEGLVVVHQIWEILSGGFFLVAVIICPVGLVVGAVMSGWEMRKRRKR